MDSTQTTDKCHRCKTRVPLTEEEIGKVAAPYYGTMGFRVEAFARAIERAHGIGEKE